MVSKDWKKQVARFLTAQTVSLFGTSLVQFAIVWYITLETSSGTMMTISVLCGFLPQLIISLWAGAWLDRYDRKTVMIWADAVIAFCTLLIAVSFLSGWKSIWLLFAALVVRSFGTGVQTPAVNAFLAQIVPQEQLVRINGINGMLLSVTFFLSPAASAAVLGWLGLEATFFIDVITAVIGIGLMFTVRSPGAVVGAESLGAGWKAVMEGLRYLKRQRFVRQQIVYCGVVGFLVSPAAFLTPLLISRTFGPELWRLSVLEMTYSGGAALGGVLITWWGGMKNMRKTLVLSTFLFAVFMVGLGVSYAFIPYLVINTLIGITYPSYNASLTAALQQRSAPTMMGRVFSLLQIVQAGALPAGMLVFGPLADKTSVQTLLIIGGALMALFAVFAWRRKSFINA